MENTNNTNANENMTNQTTENAQQQAAPQQPAPQAPQETGKKKRNWKQIGMNILKGLGVAAVAAGAGLGGYVLGSHNSNSGSTQPEGNATGTDVQSTEGNDQ